MRYLVVFFLLLTGYTFMYAGVSKFTTGLTASYSAGAAAGG
jgi:uncharacterized membrane protein YphA (DoxX/SURF4 family)